MRKRVQGAIISTYSLFIPAPLRPGSRYSWNDFRADLIAGVTVAIIQVPQSMALALIAGLPAIFGLYASLLGFIASLWGSSRLLSTGPVAIVSVLTFTSLTPFAEPFTAEYIGFAASLALLVGTIYLLLGLFRFGFILQLVPNSVITGFTSAAAIIIIVSQLPTFFGLPAAAHSLVLQNLYDFIFSLPNLSLIALGVGTFAAIFLAFFRRLPATFPGALIILVCGIAFGYFVSTFSDTNLPLVGAIPHGIPDFILPPLNTATLFLLFPKAAIIAIVGFVGAHATAKNVALKTREQLNTDQELVGQGLANIATSFFQGFPVSGSFTRTTINVDAGARSSIASVIGVFVTILTLLFFTPLFSFLPRSILAAIVIVSAIPVINFARLRHMTDISRTDGLVAVLTLILALFLTPDDAIFLGVVSALMVFIWQTTSASRVSEMGINPEWNILRGVHTDDTARTFSGTVIAYIGISMYYANAEHLLSHAYELVENRMEQTGETVHTLVLDLSGVHFMDISALEAFSTFVDRMREKNIQIGVIYLRAPVRARLEKMRLSARIIIFHNIMELRRVCKSPHHTPTGKTIPEYLEAAQE